MGKRTNYSLEKITWSTLGNKPPKLNRSIRSSHSCNKMRVLSWKLWNGIRVSHILVPRGRAPFRQHQESRPLARSNNGSPRFTDFPSLCACSESSMTNLIGSGLNLLCLQIHSKSDCRWTWPEVAILGADQKQRGLWGRERVSHGEAFLSFSHAVGESLSESSSVSKWVLIYENVFPQAVNFMQIKVIFAWKVLQEDSFWNRTETQGKMEMAYFVLFGIHIWGNRYVERWTDNISRQIFEHIKFSRVMGTID